MALGSSSSPLHDSKIVDVGHLSLSFLQGFHDHLHRQPNTKIGLLHIFGTQIMDEEQALF
jgi:hypothetical protein